MNEKDVELLTTLVSLGTETVISTLTMYLKNKYGENKVHGTQDYIYAVGDIPICMVAHCDTVFTNPPLKVYYDRREEVMLASGEGCGWDDRAGVFGIIKLIQAGLRPSVILTNDEEIGGVGASKFSIDFPKPLSEIYFMIELDRRGKNDCVFYDCDNEKFVKFIERFGFKENWGSFSDIAQIAPVWGVAAVNLSIGYENEHTAAEILHIDYMFDTIRKVKKILRSDKIKRFEYIPSVYSFACGYGKMSRWGEYVKCDCCGNYMDEYETIPVKDEDGTTSYYCIDCIENSGVLDICDVCGSIYKKNGDNLCPTCRQNLIERGVFF